MIKAVIFDVGGVLHTDEMKFVRQDIISTLGLTKKIYESSYSKLIQPLSKGEISEKQFWTSFIKEATSKVVLPEKSLFTREFSKRFKVNKDVNKIVKSLKAQDYKLAVLSNTIKSHVEVNKKMGIYDNFPIRILSCEVGLKKPDPSIYKLALDKLGTKSEETVFIDDKQEFVNVAEKLGLKGINFKNARNLIEELKNLGIKVNKDSTKIFYAGGFLYDSINQKVLLHKRDDKTKNNPNTWAFFGGLSKNSETPIETFKRELREEIDVRLKDDSIEKLTNYFNPDFSTHRYVFYALFEETSNLKLREGESYGWFTLKETFSQNLTKRTKQDLSFFMNISS